MSIETKKVVIAGGGIGGAQLAYQLQNKAEVTLIDPKEFFEVPMAAPREMLHPEFSDNAVIPYADFLTEGRHIHGEMVSVSKDTVTVTSRNEDSPKDIAYDILILATGSRYRSALVKAHFGTKEERRRHYEMIRAHIKGAERILIAGGGPVGVEITAEVLETYPEKKLTLVHSHKRLLADTAEKAARKAARYLADRGVNIIFGEKIVDNHEDDVILGPKTATTDSGREIEFDLLLWCIGAKHDASYMKDHFPDTLDENGRIRVESNLLVAGQSNIFALGDVTALHETKLAAWTTMHVRVVRKNVETLLKDPAGDKRKFKKWKPKTGNPLMLVALGPRNGVGAMPWGRFLADYITKKLKSPNMLVSMYRKILGQSKGGAG